MHQYPIAKKNCWKCKKEVSPEWIFCPYCATRLQDTRVSFPPEEERDIKFLHDLYSYGWYNRNLASIILYESIVTIRHYYAEGRQYELIPMIEAGRAQKILRLKIFAEYMALLEAFGYLCIAIRERKTRSMIWTYLNSEPQEVVQFYNQVLNYRKLPNLPRLLNLPTPSQIKKASVKHPEIILPELEKLGDRDGIYEPILQNIRICAELYRDNSGLNVRIYNKIKHVFSIIEGQNWIFPPPDLTNAAILVDILNGIAQISPFDMTQEKADDEMINIRRVTAMGSELMAVCIGLNKLGILCKS